MDRCLLPYVTFLQEHDPAPFAEYILARELIGDETEAEDAYAWAKQFALYDDLAGEQREDGSWGAYLSAETATSKNCRYKTTARALQRARDLALPADDPAVVRARALLHRYLSGETLLPDTMSPRNFTQRAGIRRQALLDLSFYEPEDEQVMRFRSLLAERLEYACASGRFDRARWKAAGIEEPLRIGEADESVLPILAFPGCIGERLQRCLLAYLWEEWHFYGIVCCGDRYAPSDGEFHFWLLLLEQLRDFSLFPEFAASQVLPALRMLCDRLIDPCERVEIKINRYHAQYGQYSASWQTYARKRNDLLLRLLRTLRCALVCRE